MIERRSAAAAVLALMTIGSDADADEAHRLALVSVGAALDRSALISLSPWHVEIVSVSAPVPSDQARAGAREARAIALANGVDAVAWLADADDARTLLLYDARPDQVVSREVAVGPIDEATAAAIALSLKTLLRASTIAPDEERLHAEEAPRARGLGLFRLEGDAAVRVRPSDGQSFDPRIGLALAWWPRPFGRALGLALGVEEGTGLAVHSSELQGRLADHAASLSARGRFVLSPSFALETALGGALHLMLLDGATVDGKAVADLARVDPAVEASLQITWTLNKSFEVGARGGAAFWGTWQEYDVDARAALMLSPLQGSLALVVGAALNP